MKNFIATLLFGVLLSNSFAQSKSPVTVQAQDLENGFKNPPKSARPYTFWNWVNGNVSKDGITKDLETMKTLGISGFELFDAGFNFPNGGLIYNSPQYHNMVKFTLSEANRLGLEAGFHNASGWSSSGGPWITPELSMKTLVWSETKLVGGQAKIIALNTPDLNLFKGKPGHTTNNNTFYKDVVVLAFPTPISDTTRLQNWEEKSLRSLAAEPEKFIATTASYEDAIIFEKEIVNISDNMDMTGKLNWTVPSGNWTIIRFGYTSNGALNRPASRGAIGLEVDKLSRKAVEVHWNEIVEKLIKDAEDSPSLSTIVIDSYEVGNQNWTDDFINEFKNKRGYDITSKLLCATGRIVDNTETTERVLWDIRATINELMQKNYFGYFAEKCHAKGLKLTIEPYGNGTFDAPQTTLIADIPMTEFWQGPVRNLWQWTSQIVSSGAHLSGKSIVGAEAFTSIKGDWKDSPQSLKAMGDLAFINGTNRYYLHSMVHQPFHQDVLPGMTFSRFGGHFNRNNTWFSKSKSWMDYIARCQFILQQGIYKADILALYGDERGFNNFIGQTEPVDMKSISGKSFDLGGMSSLNNLSVDANGDIRVSANGKLLENRYKVLLLKRANLMLPENVEKLAALADKGAKIFAPKPLRSPSLSDYAKADKKIEALIKKYWDKGIIQNPKDFNDALKSIPADCTTPDSIYFNHHQTIGRDFYFISSQKKSSTLAKIKFNIQGKQPEIWDALTGEINDAENWAVLPEGFTEVTLPLDASASCFVVFSKATSKQSAAKMLITKPLLSLTGKWTVEFDTVWGTKKPIVLDSLMSLSLHNNEEVKYFSGTATYSKSFTVSANKLKKKQSVYLDLGDVEVLAKVKLNGKDLGTLWTYPFKINITSALKNGINFLEIEVTNLWINRLIGDGRLPAYPANPNEFPKWMSSGEAPPKDIPLRTFSAFNHWKANDKLVPSGLMGPVIIAVETKK